ncbi:MAG TPA: CHAT domain-containing protein [Thermoanaerobaculia bacterium]|nr:CHAT domain-containing protein [Thermoanaerobaculia bacterium]
MAQRYLDFSVGIESTAGGGYLVRAFTGSAEAESATELPFDSEGLSELMESLMDFTPFSPVRNLGCAPSDRPAEPDLEKLGRALFAALFPGQVGELYVAEWNAARQAGQGLRIRLHLRPSNPELAWLSRVPWEIGFDERVGGFPCLNPLNPLIRHLDLPRPAERIPFRSPLRVLVVAASPAGFQVLDLERERESMERARQVRVTMLEGGGPEDLRRALAKGRYQILHFMGHGLSDSGQGSLVFSTSSGHPRPVSGRELSHLLQGSSIRLIILNACHSAAVPDPPGDNALAGVAGALVRGGQPAVVGMQLAIADTAALTFSEVLYERLAAGDPVEAAVSEARLAVYLADSSSASWIAPVLFLRGADPRWEERRSRRRPEREINRVNYISDVIKAGDFEISGSGDAANPGGRSNYINVESRITNVKNTLRITGSGTREPE